MKDDTAFLNVSAYVRVREKHLLDTASIDRIADASNTQEALRMISQNSDYDFSALRRPEDYETVVKAELSKVYAMAYDIARNFPEIVEIPACKYDYHNVKVALKAKCQNLTGELPYVKATPVAPEAIAGVVEKFDPKNGLPAYVTEAIRAGGELFEQSKNPQEIDIGLDKLMYAHMLGLCGKLGNDFITGYVRTAIDFYNVKTMLRVKNMQKGTSFLTGAMVDGGNTDTAFIVGAYGKAASSLGLAFLYKSYGAAVKAGMESFDKTGNYSGLERMFDNYLISYVKDAKRVSFGPEILFSYLISKENEIRQIRIMVACKSNGVATDILKERLRDNYV